MLRRAADGIYEDEIAPGANLDWPVQWSDWLNGSKIVTSEWFCDSELVTITEKSVIDDTLTTAFISIDEDGLGEEFLVHNRIVTDDEKPRTEIRTLRLRCRYH